MLFFWLISETIQNESCLPSQLTHLYQIWIHMMKVCEISQQDGWKLDNQCVPGQSGRVYAGLSGTSAQPSPRRPMVFKAQFFFSPFSYAGLSCLTWPDCPVLGSTAAIRFPRNNRLELYRRHLLVANTFFSSYPTSTRRHRLLTGYRIAWLRCGSRFDEALPIQGSLHRLNAILIQW
jgi:hypothetical protein